MTQLPTKNRWRARLLLISVFLIIGSGIAYELLIAACSSHLWGDSIYQFSLTIGLFMSAMGVGSYLTQKIEKALVASLAWTFLALSLFGSLSYFTLRMADLYTASFLFVAHSWTVLLGLLVGLTLPLAIRIVQQDWQVKELLAQVLLIDYLGALAGSLAMPWFLLPKLGFSQTSIAVAMVCWLSCLALFMGFSKSSPTFPSRWMWGLGGLLLLWWWGSGPLLQTILRHHHKHIKEVYVKRSRYQEIRFVRYKQSHFLFLNRQPQFGSQDEHRYHEALVHPAMSLAKSRKRVLLLGGGDGLALREIWRYHDVQEVVMVDLDPAMTDFGAKHPLMRKMNRGSMTSQVRTQGYCLYTLVCPKISTLLFQKQHPNAASCPLWKPQKIPSHCQIQRSFKQTKQRLRVVNQDAWKYIEQEKRPFSVILSDLPDATNISLSKLYSVEFYRVLHRRLSKEGMMAVQSTAIAPGYRKTFWCILHTIQKAGFHAKGYHAWVPSFGVHTSYTLAAKQALTPKRIKWNVQMRFLNQEIIPTLFWFPKDLAEVQTRINSIDTHILLRYLLKGR